MTPCSACKRPLQYGKPRCMYCGAPAVAAAPVAAAPAPVAAAPASMALPPGRPAPPDHIKTTSGPSAEAFAQTALLFLKERMGELADASRVARTRWVVTPPRHPAWPYVPPDHELFFDAITADGVGYLFRYAGDDALPVPDADDPLFAPIQAPLPFSRVDLEAAGELLALGALREVVLVVNVVLEAPFVDRVSRLNHRVIAAGAPAGREVRLMSFTWDPANPDEWRTIGRDASASRSSQPRDDAARATTNAGNRLAEKGLFQEALLCHDEAIRLDPGFALAWSNKAYVLANLGRHPESLAAAERALSLDARLEQAWINVSQALMSLGRLAEALQVAERGLAVAPRSAPLHFNAALSADKTHRQPAAVAHYRSFIELATPAMKGEVELAQQRLRVYRA